MNYEAGDVYRTTSGSIALIYKHGDYWSWQFLKHHGDYCTYFPICSDSMSNKNNTAPPKGWQYLGNLNTVLDKL